ncbi:hypothetical protein [Microbacterium azadirachtae]|uniref:hypothetical protein n=1 Tax=Microbacterium azadirachtae TaxID=582680 RepID=UPI000880E597|nr:hypothetical protein [Microbacterium azadirachtae]SDL30250.1 hypothetical protein SAMN04488593_0627 [Microbacterium azadirachtae]SEF60353.1 hypothetical protein SAMN04488594_0617 [Microbacterium azadirachtae]SEF60972.1 hypothetical protein SAMN04488592_0626 [Microbacterium azadirachtae]
MTVSTAYAELGGGTGPAAERRTRRSTTIDRAPGRICARHMFDPVSGWCGCGLRDDGQTAPGSPAWRAAIDKTMPDPNGDTIT